jgi:hypothetical protein
MVRLSFTPEEILVTVKAYPSPSARYVESSCTAGLTRDREWLRLHPLPFRMLEDDQRFGKYQWIRARIKKSEDPRPESHKIDCDSIQVLDESLPSGQGWAQRRKFLEPVQRCSMEEILQEQEVDGISLSFFRPRRIERLIIEPTSACWTPPQLTYLLQQSFFPQEEVKSLEKVPYDFKYGYWCEDPRCRGHTQKIVDWEIYQSYRSWRARYGPDGWEEKLRERYEREMQEKNETHFFVGTMRAHPKSWIIVGLFYPPMTEGKQMALDL